MACFLTGVAACPAATPRIPDDEIVLMPRFEVNETKFGPWIHARCDDFEVLSDQSTARTRSFAVDFAAFLHFTRQVCPELLLPEGTKLTIILAGPERFAELVPTFPSPLGYAELPWGVLARTQDTAVIAMRYEGVPGTLAIGRDAPARDTLINAQATYFNDPALVAHRKVLHEGPGPGTLFTTAVGESRPFLASRQTFLKTGVITVIAGMASASRGEFTFHDQVMRWEHYFGTGPGKRTLGRAPLPVKTLPPLENVFAIDIDSPAWASPLHRLERDALIHWALLANGPQRAHVFLDFLSRAGAEPPPAGVFETVFGGDVTTVTATLMAYLNPTASDSKSGLPSKNFWNYLPQDHARAAARSYVSKPAFPEDSARIRADFMRLVGNAEGAQRALAPRFKRNQLNDDIWITTGLMMIERGEHGEAARCIENAIAMKTRRPLPFVVLAALRLREAALKHGAEGTFAPEETRGILALLSEAAARPPALRETPLLLSQLAGHATADARAEITRFLTTEAGRHPYDTRLFLTCASRLARAGVGNVAGDLLSAARASTFDTDALRQVDAAEAALRTPAPQAPVARLPVSDAVVPDVGVRGFSIPDLLLEMVCIPPGRFRMGAVDDAPTFMADQTPATRVTIHRGFWIGRCEVTQRQWREVMATTLEQQRDLECRDLPLNGAGDSLPMYNVSWDEATEFCRRLTAREQAAGRITRHQAYQLPTEAQWEYACRAGSTEPIAGNPEDVAWLPLALEPHWAVPFNNTTYVPTVHPVGGKLPNAWGLSDMYGNVSEWCRDWYAPRLPGGEIIDEGGPASGVFRVVRGGNCWGIEAGVPVIGAAVRSKDLPTARFARGFRVVLEDLPATETN